MAGRYQTMGDVETPRTIDSASTRTGKALFQPPSHLSEAQRGCLLSIFIVISGCTAITGALTALALFYFMVVALAVDTNLNGDSAVHGVVQLYGIALCIIVTFVEMEWSESIRSLTILQSWTVRGLAYTFVALLIFQETGSVSATLLSTRHLECVQWPSLLLLFFGLLYFLMGILCLKRVRDTKMARYIQLLSHIEVSFPLHSLPLLNPTSTLLTTPLPSPPFSLPHIASSRTQRITINSNIPGSVQVQNVIRRHSVPNHRNNSTESFGSNEM